jgi:hypothetical protein
MPTSIIVGGAASALFGVSAGTAAAIGLGASSLVQSRKARKEEEKARRLQEKRNRLQERRQAQQQVRQIQQARATITQQGENSGLSGSSILSQAIGSVVSQGFGNIQFLNQIGQLNSAITSRLIAANSARGRASNLSALASLAGTFSEQIDAGIDSLFGRPDLTVTNPQTMNQQTLAAFVKG